MRQLIIIGTITVCLTILNYFVPMAFLFETEKVSKFMFRITGESDIDTTVMILNIGDLSGNEMTAKIDSIIQLSPKSIGLDLCDIDNDSLLHAKYGKNSLVTILECNTELDLQSSLINSESPSRFKTDNPDYFEIRLTDSWDKLQKRGNESEIINYKGVRNRFFTFNLEDETTIPLKDKIVLIGYMGETLPTNVFYADLLETGMYQIQYSAFIVSTIINDDFINESGFIGNTLLILVAVLLNYLLLTVVPIKNPLLLTIFACVLMGLINSGLIWIFFVLFNKGFYLGLSGLNSILVITTLYTCLTKIEKIRQIGQVASAQQKL